MNLTKKLKIKKKRPRVGTQGITFLSIAFGVKSKSSIELIMKQFKNDLTIPSNIGAGILVYSGFASVDETMFVGFCDNIQRGIVKFFYDENNASLYFKKFIAYLNSLSTTLSDFSLTSLEGHLCLDVSSSMTSENEYIEAIKQTAQVQRIKVPKFEVTQKNELIIGSKSSKKYMHIQAIQDAKDQIKTLCVQCLLDETAKQVLFFTIKNNINVEILDIFAYFVLKNLEKYHETSLLSLITTYLIKSYNISSVKDYSTATSVISSKSGQTVSRSFATILNKIKTKENSTEIQAIILKWLEDLLNNQQNNLVNPDDFLKSIETIIEKVKQVVPDGGNVNANVNTNADTPSSGRGGKKV
jgi:hypothetical protein